MNRRQQQILRAYTDWSVADILIDPDAGIAHAKASQYGSSHYTVAGEHYLMQTTAKGIELRRHYDGQPIEVLLWRDVAAYARALDQCARVRLRAARRSLTESQVAYPTFAASRAAQGCGRAPAIGPVTEAQDRYEREWQTWHDERLLPWQAARREVDAELASAVDAALPQACDSEPMDLLELIAAGGA